MNKIVAQQFEIFCGNEIKDEDWLWCNRCHRTYKAIEFRKLKEQGKVFLLCHYRDCTGDLPLDSRPWSRLTESNPLFPKTPLKGKVYDPAARPEQQESIPRFDVEARLSD